MRLYRIGALWRGTEADAKAAAKEAGEDWHKVEVPTDKPGLLGFLNQLAPAAPVDAPIDDALEDGAIAGISDAAKRILQPGSCPRCDRAPAAAALIADGEDLQAVETFILDRAKPSQIERIFAALGTRFHELRKAAEARS